ncbi:hypothetical protein DBR43_04060 [Pedobacter sp. KBW06]|uniref:DUF6266 family protein n=1 Tax=Pedobacter sp. KBW06 TaxID=2153359 RepID=UPI000F5A3C62|nr:DUF6266 family protein [Pedobacter sp. KBW06]RQO74570.1 hypothetical protein DBR43_04060 [Pedobacter sp. KBW06]
MAKAPNGVLGPLRGKIKNLVFYVLNGQPVVRTIGKTYKKPSINQLANYQAMSVTMDLIRPITGFINSSFELEASGTIKNAHNLATSYNKKKALKGEYPNIGVDYSKVVLSYGELEVSTNLKMKLVKRGVHIRWDGNGGYGDDIVMILLLHPLSEYATFTLNACRRDAGQYLMEVTETSLLNEPIEAYICFKSADGRRISNSTYLGNLNG